MQFESTTRWPDVKKFIEGRLEQHRRELEGVSVEGLTKLQAKIEVYKTILSQEKTGDKGL